MQQGQSDLPRHIDETATKLVQASAELDKFRKVFGDLSSLPPNTSELAARVQALSEEAERFRLLNTQYEQSESSLYEELEKLSTAWESADKQLNNKVFDLFNMEDRLQKSVVEVSRGCKFMMTTLIAFHRKPSRITSTLLLCGSERHSRLSGRISSEFARRRGQLLTTSRKLKRLS
jgi:BRE1 E3 ubiquitin ligase